MRITIDAFAHEIQMMFQHNFKFNTIIYFAVFYLGLTATAIAGDEINIDENGFVLHGYDPVSYHLGGEAKPGNSSHEAEYNGAKYRFVSAENKKYFVADPERYTPEFGGYCSYGVRVGKKFDIDPQAWTIVDKKLYVQLDQGTHIIWKKDLKKNIEISTRLWPSIIHIPVEQLGE